MKARVILDVDRDKQTGCFQVSIGNGETGYRLDGPKYRETSTNIVHIVMDEIDAEKVRGYIDAAFPPDGD